MVEEKKVKENVEKSNPKGGNPSVFTDSGTALQEIDRRRNSGNEEYTGEEIQAIRKALSSSREEVEEAYKRERRTGVEDTTLSEKRDTVEKLYNESKRISQV